MLKNYKIVKIMNNNIILAENLRSKKEAVLIGKGIGFGKTIGEEVKISKENVEKTFITHDENIKNDYFKLVNSIDDEIIELCSDLILKAEEKLGKLNSRIHVVLTDHISFALERINMGLKIENPFIEEIKILYEEEYDLAVKTRKILKNKLNIDIGKGEVGFIALHLNAARQNKAVKETFKKTRILKELVNLIEDELNCKIDRSITYNRLIDHLKGCLDRVESESTIENPLIDVLKKEFFKAFNIAKKVKEKIYKELEIEVPEGELGYLAIHINRIMKINKI